jgi:hypothetical protein
MNGGFGLGGALVIFIIPALAVLVVVVAAVWVF